MTRLSTAQFRGNGNGWTATGLACEFDIPYRTLMRWLRQFRAIKGTKMRGKPRRVFDKTDAALCIMTRRGLELGLSVPAVNYLLDFLRFHFEACFLNPPPAGMEDQIREFKGSSWLVIPVSDSFRTTMNQALIRLRPDPSLLEKDEPIIIGSCVPAPPTPFADMVTMVRERTNLRFVIISIPSILRELEGRIDATAHNRDYKEISLAGDQTLALALLEEQKLIN
jgi:hypothetical protein